MGGPSGDKVVDPVIAALIRRREELGLPQYVLARMMETSQSAVSELESGHTSPTLRTLRRMAECLRVDLEIRELIPVAIERDILHLRSLEPDQLERALLERQWYVHPNDLIGGWCVMPVDAPPSCGCFSIADFVSRSAAEHIVLLHNTDSLVMS